MVDNKDSLLSNVTLSLSQHSPNKYLKAGKIVISETVRYFLFIYYYYHYSTDTHSILKLFQMDLIQTCTRVKNTELKSVWTLLLQPNYYYYLLFLKASPVKEMLSLNPSFPDVWMVTKKTPPLQGTTPKKKSIMFMCFIVFVHGFCSEIGFCYPQTLTNQLLYSFAFVGIIRK